MSIIIDDIVHHHGQQPVIVRKIQFNRPDKMNALTVEMYLGLVQALNEATERNDIRVVVLHGDARAFTSGNDVADFLANPPKDDSSAVMQFLHALNTFPKPLLAAVNSQAVGVGTTMLLHCDLVYAGENTQFAVPFSKLALCPEARASQLIPQLCGHVQAFEKLILGDAFDAAEAHRIGLINRVLPDADVLDFTLAQAKRLSAMPPDSVRTSKKLMKQTAVTDGAEVIRLEARDFVRLLNAPEAKEAFTAFLEKRKPDFSQFG
jgi:enoyl-CoA hydratase/carnithine racemase